MNRRSFLDLSITGHLGLIMIPKILNAGLVNSEQPNDVKRYFLTITKRDEIELSEGKRFPFGWHATSIKPENTLVFKLKEKLPGIPMAFRVSVAQGARVEFLLHARSAGTKTYLGAFDIRYSSALSIYELTIDKKHINEINELGIEVKLQGPTSLWIFDENIATQQNALLAPHFLPAIRKGRINDFLDCFLSVNSVQPFGWREGCVLDGLWQIHERKGDKKALNTIKEHLSLFIDENQNLVYETLKGGTMLNELDGIESTLPFAILAKLDAKHQVLPIVTESWKKFTKKDGVVTVNAITAEGCYTVAWPMAVIGKARQDEDLMKNAIMQLKHRFILYHEGHFYLRYCENGTRTFRNWARGVAWILLGFVRTIVELKDIIYDEEIVQKYKEGVDLALSMQQSNGLWNCFMDKDVLPDTSGSAGIAAAILTGVNHDILPETYWQPAEKCWSGLIGYLTPDGLLSGTAQGNQGGIELQESNYRVISQMGMGLMAQLYAAP